MLAILQQLGTASRRIAAKLDLPEACKAVKSPDYSCARWYFIITFCIAITYDLPGSFVCGAGWICQKCVLYYVHDDLY